MILINWLLSALAVMLVQYIVPGFHVDSFLTALLVALVLGLANAVIRPILVVLTLPITILTLGLFLLVINGLLIMLVDAIISGFTVDGLGTAILGSIVLAIIGWLIDLVFKPKTTPAA